MAKVSPQEQAIRDRRAAQKRGDVRRLPGVGDQVIDATFRVESKPVPALVAPASAPIRRDRAAAQALVERVRRSMADQARDLLELHEWGWKELGYRSWRACVIAEFGKSERTAYRYLAAARESAEVSQNDKPQGELPRIEPTPDRGGRPLKVLDAVPARQRGALLNEAADRAKAKGTTRNRELTGVVAEAGYPVETAKASASKVMAPTPRLCPHCGRPID